MSFTSWQYPFLLFVVVVLFRRIRSVGRYWLVLTASFVFYGAWDLRFIALILAAAAIDWLCACAIDGRAKGWAVTLGASLLPAGWLGAVALAAAAARAFGDTSAPGPAWATRVSGAAWASDASFGLAAQAAVAGLGFGCLYRLCLRRSGRDSDEPHRRRRRLLLLAIAGNLAILATFKYANFFLDNLQASLRLLGVNASWSSLAIILPVGVSFHTFQSIAYAVDVYRRKLPAERSFGRIVLMICFFPQMVAGPIERAAHILPQLKLTQRLSAPMLVASLHLLLTGFFLKIFVADNCAVVANYAFNSLHQGLPLNAQWTLMGTFAFAMQIYGDFAGYSYIARGSALLMGVQLARNFANPYLARSPSDFWRRWHVSLSQWIRDYLYVPLGGNRRGGVRTGVNLWLTMLLAGLWHGSTWMFVLWGAYHALLLSAARLRPFARPLPAPIAVVAMFALTCVGWFIFRSANPADLMRGVHALSDWSTAQQEPAGAPLRWLALHSLPVLALALLTRKRIEDAQFPAGRSPLTVAILYALMLIAILTSGGPDLAFIYFQF